MKKVKIFCHTCEHASGMVKEKEYPVGREIWVLCPECGGKGYTEMKTAKS